MSKTNVYFGVIKKNHFLQHDEVDRMRTTTVHLQHKSVVEQEINVLHQWFLVEARRIHGGIKGNQKTGSFRVSFRKKGENCQKMSKNAKNRENWSFAMSCSSKTSMVRSGFFYIVSKIMHERTTTENLVTIARWFFSNYKVALHLNNSLVRQPGWRWVWAGRASPESWPKPMVLRVFVYASQVTGRTPVARWPGACPSGTGRIPGIYCTVWPLQQRVIHVAVMPNSTPHRIWPPPVKSGRPRLLNLTSPVKLDICSRAWSDLSTKMTPLHQKPRWT